MSPDLCLGTAQFGMDYGITNNNGKVAENEVGSILTNAQIMGIKWLDTAPSYGDAEAVIGRQLSGSHQFRLISKLKPQPKERFNSKDVDKWEIDLSKTCEHLGKNKIDSLLVHSPKDIQKPGGTYLSDWLTSIRRRGLVRRIGISIYSEKELEMVNQDLLDIVQVPLSLFDQRLIQDGTVKKLTARGTSIHARSIYLQGLLLTPADHWPTWIEKSIIGHQRALEQLARKKGCSLIELALGFIKDQSYLEAVVIGVSSIHELKELQEAWSSSNPWNEEEWRAWALQEQVILDPRRWPN